MTRDEFMLAADELFVVELEKMRARSARPKWMRCRGETCVGWKILELVLSSSSMITRCGVCARFKDGHSAVTHVVRKLMANGKLSGAHCGSPKCVACYLKLHHPGMKSPPMSMPREERAQHIALWALIDEAEGR